MTATAAPPPVRSVVAQDLQGLGAQDSAEFFVYLHEQADLNAAPAIANKVERTTHVYEQLTTTAAKSQAGVASVLDEAKVQYRKFWISNVIWVKGDKALIDTLATRADVERIEAAGTRPLITPTPAVDISPAVGPEWGVANIEAPRVWSEFDVRGESIVVANIDGGVQYNHPALVGKYRGNLGGGQFDHNYNWFDPSNVCSSAAPCDGDGHGTHTMGTMVGDDGAGNQIGVAPDATWFASRGCETNTCSESALLASGQFVLAPTDLAGNNPRPDLRADIVNNSWGGGSADLWYQQTIQAWVAAGMFPAFASGNAGPSCNTSNSPSDNPEAYAVGGFDINNNIYTNSSRGPGIGTEIKPDISAPAVAVRSSVIGSGYASFTGTSMATPHVAGTVALIWSSNPALKGNVDATKQLLDTTAIDVDSTGCGGTAANNNNFGEGRLNAFAVVNAGVPAAAGRVEGVVTNAATSAPIDDLKITSGNASVLTGADGSYSLKLPAGVHTVTASRFGFFPQSVEVTVTDDGTVTQNFALTPQSSVTLSGQVTDGSGKGYPLYAKIEIPGLAAPIFTNPANGRYSVGIVGPATYRATVTALYAGYQTVVADVEVGATDTIHNFAVPVDATTCTARGYGFPTLVNEAFNDTTAPPAGWSVVNRTASGGWVFNDPGARGNLTGGSGGFAIIDSDDLGVGQTQDTDLITPTLDLTGVTTPVLEFNSDYRAFTNGFGDVDVSIDGGTTWTTLLHQTTTSRRGPRVERIPLTGAANQANVKVRFHYTGTFAWWWQVDNVRVFDPNCLAQPGGLVVGFVTDRNTDAGINGATVTGNGVTATTVATPDDPNIGDGFYSLFSAQVGTQAFTASKSPYQPLTKDVNVVNNGTRQLNFALRAGRLTVTPTSVTAFVPYGGTRTTTVTVTNTGTAPATVEVLERGGGFELLNRQGSEIVNKPLTDKQAGKGAVGGNGLAAQGVPAPRIDDAWTSKANYPVSAFDMSAVTIEGKIYTFGNASASTTSSAFTYDIATDTWSALPNMPRGREKPQAVAVDNKIYIFGGWAPSSPSPVVDVFDVAANSWSTLPATNPAPRAAAGAGVVDGKIYLVGGCVDSACNDSANVTIFDPAGGTFSSGTPYPQLSSWMSCGGIGSKIYCAGGAGASAHATGFAYTPAADSWAPIADMPTDMWGSAHATANGMLVIMGGVTGQSTVITNRSLAYDPSANSWLELPAAQFARYRGAGACGVFKIGGRIDNITASNNVEHLGGLEDCTESSDLPWLAITPASFTLGAGKSRTLTVTLSATAEAGVLQPGTYEGEFGFRSDTPYATDWVSVTMNVQPPTNWGKITGTITGQPCTGGPVGVPATIRMNLNSSPDIGYSLRADNQGHYAFWLPRGRYTFIVAKDGWIPEAGQVQISAGFVLTHNVTLEPFTPC